LATLAKAATAATMRNDFLVVPGVRMKLGHYLATID
jgi:hypothetical protein